MLACNRRSEWRFEHQQVDLRKQPNVRFKLLQHRQLRCYFCRISLLWLIRECKSR